MTNGNISARVDAATGPKLTAPTRAESRPSSSIRRRRSWPLSRAQTDLGPGAAIIARGPKQEDGSIDAAFVLIGKDGLVRRCEV
jgi:hypothetical protein